MNEYKKRKNENLQKWKKERKKERKKEKISEVIWIKRIVWIYFFAAVQ